jgi:hypothetical protein
VFGSDWNFKAPCDCQEWKELVRRLLQCLQLNYLLLLSPAPSFCSSSSSNSRNGCYNPIKMFIILNFISHLLLGLLTFLSPLWLWTLRLSMFWVCSLTPHTRFLRVPANVGSKGRRIFYWNEGKWNKITRRQIMYNVTFWQFTVLFITSSVILTAW